MGTYIDIYIYIHQLQKRGKIITVSPIHQERIASAEYLYNAAHPLFWQNVKGISLENMPQNMVLTYLHFRILKFPLTK